MLGHVTNFPVFVPATPLLIRNTVTSSLKMGEQGRGEGLDVQRSECP